MNWFDSERQIHEHVMRAETAARHYPHIAHLVEQESGRRRLNHVMLALGGLLVNWGNQLQTRWAIELPDCSGTAIQTMRQ